MRNNLVLIFTLILLFLPATLYFYKFGFGLWETHEDWAKMGGFFGGVLGPILASFSLFFLGYQYHLQTEDRLINIFEEDVMNFLPKLSKVLKSKDFKENMRKLLLDHKLLIELDKNLEAELLINKYIGENIRPHTLWVQIDASMRNLKKRSDFRHRRMRTYILSECNIEDLVLMDQVNISISSESTEDNCLFLDS